MTRVGSCILTTRAIAAVQGAYYLATGLLPFVSYRAFERITGPKVDDWLVRMVGLLAAVIGAVLVRDARAPRATARTPDGSPDRQLAVASAVAFAAIDTWYAGRGRISRVYLLDAAAELALVGAWLAAPAGATTPGPD